MDENHLVNRQIRVIIPVYNCKSYLQCAVESVISQPYQSISVILVDDGSTDGSSLLCDELAARDDRIAVIHQKNSGVSGAGNTGLKRILSIEGNENDYIAFLDADDSWEANWINSRISKLLEQEFDLIGMQSCICNHLLTRRSEAVYMQEKEYRGGVASIWIHSEQHIGAMLYRVDLIKRYGIRFYNIKASEDKIFSMQCLYLADKIYLVNQLMYLYRQNAASSVHMRNRGISYFVPIIDAYIQSDAEMARWSNENRSELHAGRILAKIYIMDMAEEELEGINGFKRLKKLFAKRPDYQRIVDTQTNNASVDQRWIYMQKHKLKFIIKSQLRGFLSKAARKIYYFQPVKDIVDEKRYPIKM